MEKVCITVLRKSRYDDLIKKYENPIKHACDMEEGMEFISIDGTRPANFFCDSAWESISPFVIALAKGEKNFYDGWMKNERSALISCNDGFRPVSFLLEVIEK